MSIETLQAYCNSKIELHDIRDLYFHESLNDCKGFEWKPYGEERPKQIVIKKDNNVIYAFLVDSKEGKESKIENYMWESLEATTLEEVETRVLQIWNKANKMWNNRILGEF